MTGPLANRAAVVVVASSFLFLVAVWVAMPWVSGDTPFVLDGTNAFLTCLSHHDYNACGYTGKLNYWGLMSPIGDWPLLQHVPDLISLGLGADGHRARTRVLEVLSVVGIGGSVALAWLVLRRIGQAVWFWSFMLVVLSSPFLWYARTTFGEALAAGLLVALVAATVLPAHPVLVGLAAVGACWTKETSYPFVAALGLLGLVLARRRGGASIRLHVLWGAAGMAVAILAASAFNEVRFGRILSPNYFERQLHTQGLGRKLEYAAAVVVSPNGGMLFLWPAVTVLVLAACILPLVRWRREGSDPVPALVLGGAIVLLTFGFASWWTPFGWFGYGARLALPWALPILLLALAAYGDLLAPLARRVLEPLWGLAVVFVLVLVFTLPTIGQMWRPNEIGHFFSQADPTLCAAPWRGTEAGWNRCQHELLWLDRPMSLYAIRGVATPGGLVTTAIVAAGILGCLVLLRTGLAEGEPKRRLVTASGRADGLPTPVASATHRGSSSA